MRAPLRLAYDAAAQVARFVGAFAPADGPKFARALAERRGIQARYAQWALGSRDVSRRLLWLHAPSVGEGLMARPVLANLRQRQPALQIAYTWFSPSAVNFARSLDVDFRDYLPLDTPNDARTTLDLLRPAAFVYSKLDLWPNFVAECRARGIRLGLISATLAPGSSRQSPVARALLHDAYAALDAVGAVDGADGDRLVRLGVRKEVLEVTGDTRYDQVWERIQRIHEKQTMLAPLRASRPTIVAGSTWPADEAVLLPAFEAARRSVPDLRLIIAPHEPTDAHIAPIESWAKGNRIDTTRLSALRAEATVVIVDTIGVLAELYSLATIAYVGGGFHASGLHSVVEPAALRLPVIVGPRHTQSRDANLLLGADAAASVSDTREMTACLLRLLEGSNGRADEMGRNALAVVKKELGAAERSTALVERLLG
jgi:3-deoxy-D-manno-octulosonic-acid transferase